MATEDAPELSRSEQRRRRAADEVAELLALEALPEDKFERLSHLREMAKSRTLKLTHCPECGRALEGLDVAGHAEGHWPSRGFGAIPLRLMSDEALEREAALYRAADQRPPRR